MTSSNSGAESTKLPRPNMVNVQPFPMSSMTYWTAATKAAPTRQRPIFNAAVTDAARPGDKSTRMVWLGKLVIHT